MAGKLLKSGKSYVKLVKLVVLMGTYQFTICEISLWEFDDVEICVFGIK